MVRLRFPILFVICLLALAPLRPALAQAEDVFPPVICGELAEEDCALLENSAAVMQEVNSYAYTQEYHLALTDFPEVPGGDLEVTMTLAGQWAVDPAAREAMLALTEMSRAATPELADKLQAEVPATVLEFFGGLAFDMDMNLTVSDAIAASISEDSDVPFPTELHLPMRIVDGMLYINIVDLKPLAPELDDVNADWLGFDLMGLMEQGMEDSAGELAAEPMDPMTTALVGMFYQRIFAAMEAYVDVERLDDVEVDGVQAAVFDFRPDLLGFFTSDELNTFIADMSELAGPDVDAPSQEEVAEVMMAVGFMAPMLFRDLELSVTSTIGVEDSYQYARFDCLRLGPDEPDAPCRNE